MSDYSANDWRNYRPNELYHYGIKGQKWGVRRYQNSDGSLTDEGRERYRHVSNYKELNKLSVSLSKYLKSKGMASELYTDDELLDFGIDVYNGIIKKGTVSQRVTDVEEGLDNYRKYVSIISDDKSNYKDISDSLLKNKDNIRVDTYEFTKDIKIANSSEVLDYLVNSYGDTKTKDFYKSGLSNGEMVAMNKYFKRKGSEISTGKLNEVKEYVTSGSKALNKLANDYLSDPDLSPRTLEYFQKKGYDAIVDAEDYISGFTRYPVIVLNPEKTMKKKDSYRYI